MVKSFDDNNEQIQEQPSKKALLMSRRTRKLTREDYENREADPIVFERLESLLDTMELSESEMKGLFSDYQKWHKDAEKRAKQRAIEELKLQMQVLGLTPEDIQALVA